MRSESGEDQASRAGSIYALWTQDVLGRLDETFHDLVERHPEQGGALQQLHARYQQLARVLEFTVEDSDSRPAARISRLAPFLDRLVGRSTAAERYEARHHVAAGGMGSIDAVFDVDLRRLVAKKSLLADGAQGRGAAATDDSTLSRFLEEAQVTAQLGHPGIVPVHEIGVDEGGRLFFTMALVGGSDLREVFERVRDGAEAWRLPRAINVLQRVCETMAFAHTRGVIHRDLKPANIMVGGFGEVYVMDWGLARLLDRDEHSPGEQVTTERADESNRDPLSSLRTQEGAVAGTPRYMAPEQARGDLQRLDQRTDVYAAGAMLYELLTGAAPYADAEGGAEVLQRVWEGPPAALTERAPEAPAELVAITERAMARRQDDRYPSMLELADDLRAWLEGRVVRAYEQGAWAELRKWILRNKALAASLCAAMLAVVGGVAGMLVVEAAGRREVAAEQQRTLRLSDTKVIDDLEAEQEGLWPANPANAEGLADWVLAASALEQRIAIHRADLAMLCERAEDPEAEDLVFARSEDAWQFEVLTGLLERLESDAYRALQVDVAKRAELAAGLAERTLDGIDATARWDEAIAAIAAHWMYEGVEVTPQLGLLPMREDPRSGLWEFWHVPSGREPQIDPETEELLLHEEDGIVLVLLPGGEITVGGVDYPAGHPLHDDYLGQQGATNERHAEPTVTLEPFFLSRYEMTGAQWARVHQGADAGMFKGELLPIESISRHGAEEALRRLDLELPTESQWEYGCRALVETRYFTGQADASLKGHANLGGKGWEDSFAGLAPVGSLTPNGFGLHDMHGNVWEWCRDDYVAEPELLDGDGRFVGEVVEGQGVIRGGGFLGHPHNTRISNRFDWPASNSSPDTGVRPARSLRPPITE